jgi:hypothetical protein
MRSRPGMPRSRAIGTRASDFNGALIKVAEKAEVGYLEPSGGEMATLTTEHALDRPARPYLAGINKVSGTVAATFVVLCLIGIMRNYSPVPIGGDWYGYLEFNLDVLDGKLDAWWAIHGSHVPIIPRLLYWLDFHCFGARRIFMIFAAMLAQAASCAMLIVYAREQIDRHALFSVSALLITLAFAWTQFPNFLKGFVGDQYFLILLFSIIAFYCLHRAKERLLWFTGALLAGIAAAGTTAGGLFVLPVMAVMSIAIGLGLRRTALIVMVSAASFALYFSIRKFYPTDTDYPIAGLNAARNPIQIALFVLTYLGSPLHFVVSYWFAGVQHLVSFLTGAKPLVVTESLEDYAASRTVGLVAATVAGGILVALAAWHACDWLIRDRKNTGRAALLALLGFLILNAGAAAIGRGISGFAYAAQERYTTPALLAWESMMLLCLARLDAAELARTLRVLVVVIPVALLPTELRVLIKADPMTGARLESLRALQTGKSDNALIAPLLPRLQAKGIDLLK